MFKKIAFDIDGTLIDTHNYCMRAFLKYYEEKTGNKYNHTFDVTCEDLNDVFPMADKKLISDFFKEKWFSEYIPNAKFRPHVKELFDRLHKMGIEIHIITARKPEEGTNETYEDVESRTRKAFDDAGIYVDVFHVGFDEKDSVIKGNGIDLIVEDNPEKITMCSYVVPVIVVDNLYNRQTHGRNIWRIESFMVEPFIDTLKYIESHMDPWTTDYILPKKEEPFEESAITAINPIVSGFLMGAHAYNFGKMTMNAARIHKVEAFLETSYKNYIPFKKLGVKHYTINRQKDLRKSEVDNPGDEIGKVSGTIQEYLGLSITEYFNKDNDEWVCRYLLSNKGALKNKLQRTMHLQVNQKYKKFEKMYLAMIGLSRNIGFKESDEWLRSMSKKVDDSPTKEDYDTLKEESVDIFTESFVAENYQYLTMSGTSEIMRFYKDFKDVFGERCDMSPEDISKEDGPNVMKAIYTDNELIGYIGFSTYVIHGKKYLGLGNFMILKKYQRSGYGSSVIRDIISKYKDSYDEIYCYVNPSNNSAVNFYKKIAKVDTSRRSNQGYYVSLYDKGTNFNESAIVVTKENMQYYPVFIFLSFTGTNMSKLIRGFTHDPYSHSSLSFDTDLTHMMSFNRDGFVTENIMDDLWRKNASHIKYSLYMYLATEEEYKSMQNFVAQLASKRDKLKYDILGLTNFIFGRGDAREDKYFCSEFVAACIAAGNPNAIKTKPCMTTPYMLAKNRNFVFIKNGTLKHYKYDQVDQIVTSKLEQAGFANAVITPTESVDIGGSTFGDEEFFIESAEPLSFDIIDEKNGIVCFNKKSKSNVIFDIPFNNPDTSGILDQNVKNTVFVDLRIMETDLSKQHLTEKDELIVRTIRTMNKKNMIKLEDPNSTDAYLLKCKIMVSMLRYADLNPKKTFIFYGVESMMLPRDNTKKYAQSTIYLEGVSEDSIRRIKESKYKAGMNPFILLEDLTDASTQIRKWKIIAGTAPNEIKGYINRQVTTSDGVDTVRLLPGEAAYNQNLLETVLSMDTFLVADLHLSTKDPEKTKRIINSINNKVTPKDTLVILGDLDGKKGTGSYKLTADTIKKLRCKNIYFILGNNDPYEIDDYVKIGFKAVTDLAVFKESPNKNIYLTHCPYPVENDDINIHGHIHGSRCYWNMDCRNHYDVWDEDFTPITIRECLEILDNGMYECHTEIHRNY